MTIDERGALASLDPFIGTYTLTYPNTNNQGTPVNSPFDPSRNTYYVAVTKGSRFGTTPTSTSFQPATTSPLTRPDGLAGGTAFTYPSSGYDVSMNSTIDGTPAFSSSRDSGGTGPYTLQLSLGAAPTAPVPEPGTMALMGLGIAGLAASRRRKKSQGEVSAAIA